MAKRTNGLWQVQDAMKVEHKNGIDLTDFLHLLVKEGNGELSPAQWQSLCASQLGLKSEGAYRKRRELAAKLGLIECSGNTNRTTYRLVRGVVFNPGAGRYEKTE